MSDQDEILKRALLRYQIISPLLADYPQWGQRRAVLKQLAAKEWVLPDGTIRQFSPDTLRKWLSQYNRGGLDALKDKERRIGERIKLSEGLIETACALKREVPERSIERIITIMEEMKLAPVGVVKRSTLHRELQKRNLSQRRLKPPQDQDLQRWQADYANDLWQADMLHGPWLPDPQRKGKKRRSYLYAFIDDASRYHLAGMFFFKGDLPALELVFRRAIQKCGIPKRCYYDNGMVFRARHMLQICAELGIRPPTHTKPYRPMGHGKIEAYNRFCKNNFIAEVKASRIATLEEVNEAYRIWVDKEYNRVRHSELGMTPFERWRHDLERFRFAVEDKVRLAFLWIERRTPDACGVVNLHRIKYHVSPRLAKKRVELRYDPEHLDEVEVWFEGEFVERARPLEIQRHRGPRIQHQPDSGNGTEIKADYLKFLLTTHGRKKARELRDLCNARLELYTTEMISVLKQRLDSSVFDEAKIREFCRRYGPFDLEKSVAVVDDMMAMHPPDLHISFYLTELRTRLGGEP